MESGSGVFQGVPTFFRACVQEARGGGSMGYEHPGWHLANGLSSLVPYDVEGEAWENVIAVELGGRLDAGDDAGVLAWLDAHYPRCMALVPQRRRTQFLAGVKRAHEDDRIG